MFEAVVYSLGKEGPEKTVETLSSNDGTRCHFESNSNTLSSCARSMLINSISSSESMF